MSRTILRFAKWDEYQATLRKDRPNQTMTWVKLHAAIIRDFRFGQLTKLQQADFMKLLALAGDYNGDLPNDETRLRWELRDESFELQPLLDAGFLVVVDADTVRHDEDVAAVEPSTDGEPAVDQRSTSGQPAGGLDKSRREEKRIEQKRVEPPLTPPAGGTSAAPAAKQRRKRGSLDWTQPEEASIRRVVTLYNAVWDAGIGATAGNGNSIVDALRANYTEPQLKVAIFAARWHRKSSEFYREEASRRRLSLLMRWKCPRGEKPLLDYLLDDASRIVLRGKALEAAQELDMLKDLEAVGVKPGDPAKVVPTDDLAKRRKDAALAVAELAEATAMGNGS